MRSCACMSETFSWLKSIPRLFLPLLFEASEDDNIAVRFAVHSVDCEKGLLAYMNVLTRSYLILDWSISILIEHILLCRFQMWTILFHRFQMWLSYYNLSSLLNHFRSNATVQKYYLKKIVEDWNTIPGDGFLYFMFRPPWVCITSFFDNLICFKQYLWNLSVSLASFLNLSPIKN